MKKMMTGNEAVARGAYEASVHFASAYPGTPSTEILENIATYKEIIAEWAPNEKVALEAVIGASFAGGRSLASMKHVGLNVAADPLFTFSYTGVNGGSVVISADEPGMYSSQNEQDNRNYAIHAKIPMLEPSNSQEAKDMMVDAFNISEEYNSVVLFRMTTRICHSKSIVELGERQEISPKPYERQLDTYVSVPRNARNNRHKVEDRMNRLQEYTETSKWNYTISHGSTVGVIASGMSVEFAKEALGETVDYLKLGFTNPLPKNLIQEFCDNHETVYIIEENDPYIENYAKTLGCEVIGKDLFPYTGEMTPDVIKRCVLSQQVEELEVPQDLIVPRPPTFCSGCPHRGFFYELGKKRKKIIVAGDIGCYSLAVGEPYRMMEWLICMGAAYSTAHGAQRIIDLKDDDDRRLVAVMGDSTFFHTGINSLLNTIYNGGNTINVILDNRITGMTGQQDNPGSGFTLQGGDAAIGDIEAICRALGVKHVRTINPNDLALVKETINWAMDLDETSVIITNWPCVLKKHYKDEDFEMYQDMWKTKDYVIEEKCTGCKACLRSGCPSLIFNPETKKTSIDPYTCVGCDVCAQICPYDAIQKEGYHE
ncbi:indolepyruvate ferredoxin oxidoreductase subunit alpha [Candidatus Xianfuyuplasma coldseepsis]|uniref:Indolepyruvate oxidoreductase subunit IorA n=1 Tax=Candidatus Xianfuyuplasma coldseepsis TaxID=2782163 RepID=A0A7L7KQU2_9MOLU|nr:indolepyruvate ferredoxin oxidoreductase subunit alpha [Xianfuyuplasma coldseepsis]QMS85047.1 indolepyruvate ferredoxin oxidoreductase subunit alpha [Xianfuyuplasma coldseepsis]